MNNKTILVTSIAFFLLLSVRAQLPAGYVKGAVTLTDGTTINGYLNDQLKKKARVSFIADSASTKHSYDAESISRLTMDGVDYRCVNGDFFKLICTGKICFMQKASNAGGRQISNGAAVIILPGTPGKIGDYFSYSNNQLTHLTAKTIDLFINTNLSYCNAALDKAKNINGDIALLAEAITLYNNSVQ